VVSSVTPTLITIGSKTGTVVYLDAHWHPVPAEKATAARVLFDDGSTAFFTAHSSAKAPGIGGITRKFDAAAHPRGDDGRFIEASQPRIFNRPSDVGQYSSWGNEQRWAWIDKETGKPGGHLLTGEPIPREQIPSTLYHVTTNAPAVESSGVLLGLKESGGLGGGQALGVSFTSSPVDATVIQRELVRAIQIARGEARKDTIERWAREDEQAAGLPEGSLQGAVDFALHNWSDQSLERTFVWDKDLPEDKRGWVGPPPPPEEREQIYRSHVSDAHKAYLQLREREAEQAAGHPVESLKNPILFGDQKLLAKLNPEHVQILETAAEDIPADALVTTGSDKFLHEVRVYADVPRKRKKVAREYVREPKGTSEGGQFASSAKVLQGVDSKANAEAQITEFRRVRTFLSGTEPDLAKEHAAEQELRALPLVHGTTVAGALGAVEKGLLSHADMEGEIKDLTEDIEDLKDSINNIVGEDADWGNIPFWTADDIEGLGLDRSDAEALLGYVQELQDIEKVITGTTNPADKKLGLDRFVFMTHGEKHQDYGNVAVIIDNEVLQDGGWATEKDIVVVPGGAEFDDTGMRETYNPRRVEKYRSMIVKGDDYYAVAAARAGSPEALLHRSREQLFEVKVPQVPKSAVKGFVVEGDYEAAQRLSDKLARRGMRDRVLYIDENYGPEKRQFLYDQLKAIQSSGMWDEDALDRFKESHEGVSIL
jgi:hypothetical protein